MRWDEIHTNGKRVLTLAPSANGKVPAGAVGVIHTSSELLWRGELHTVQYWVEIDGERYWYDHQDLQAADTEGGAS